MITLSTLTIRQASTDEFDAVLDLLGESVRWLRSKGLDQWSTWERWRIKMRPSLERGDVWLLCDGGSLIGTVTVETEGDPDFWSAAELADPAAYVSKLAITRDRAGQGLGQLLLEWASDHAYRYGCEALRLDAWKTNERLHAFYLEHGWTYLRTSGGENRKSGALFEISPRPVAADLRATLTEIPDIPAVAAPFRAPAESPSYSGNWQPAHTHWWDQLLVEMPWVSEGPITLVPGYRYRVDFRKDQWQLDISQPGQRWKPSGRVVSSSWPLDPQSAYVLSHDDREPCSVRLAEFRPGTALAPSPRQDDAS